MKKFLCYDTNDAASGKINVSANGVLKPNSTVPSTNGVSYQQLVTDGSGNTKWEDRLAYESDPVTTKIFKESIFSFSHSNDELYVSEEALPEQIHIVLQNVRKIVIVWDGAEYKYNIDIKSFLDINTIFAGNGGLFHPDLEDTGDPFVALLRSDNIKFFTKNTKENHIISIFIVSREVQQIDKKFISGNNIMIGHDEEDENGGYSFIESYNPTGIVKVLDVDNQLEESRIMFDGEYLRLQSDIFIKKMVNGGRTIISYDIPTSVGEKYETVEKRAAIINALSSTLDYLIQYDFIFNNNVYVRSYLSKFGAYSKFASAVVSAENGMVYSITLKLNSDNKTAKVVLNCIA